jgi:hypothetical protein
MTVFALLGAGALWLTYLWLASAIAGAYLSGRKGYGERPGLASGLLLNLLGPIIWLIIPAKDESMWKTVGPWGSTPKAERDRLAAETEQHTSDPPPIA